MWFPILNGSDDPTDNIWRWVSLAGLVLFLLIKKGVIIKLKDKEMKRIQELNPETRYFFLCYSLPRVLFLTIMISCFKVIEIYTEQYYASRIIFGSSATAVGILLTACCLSILKDLRSDETLGRIEQDGAQRLDDALVPVV